MHGDCPDMEIDMQNEAMEMWFSTPQGLTFKVVVSVRNALPGEVLELARLNWDHNKAAGFEPRSTRP